ncbi:MAG: hypothetical protein HY678_12115 [Chloroflexi bacterium]|nr:hypothetical protein [Chloroflexota bacterium]
MKRSLVAGVGLLALAALVGWAVVRSLPPVERARHVDPSPNLSKSRGVSPGSPLPDDDGSRARFGITGTIDYAVRDADGRIKAGGVIHNTINNDAKNEVFNRIAAGASSTAFDGIAALSVSVGTDDPSNGVLAGSIALNLDGDSGTSGNQNPADGTVTTQFSTDPGQGTISVTFTAKVDSVSVKQIVLTKAVEDDTAVGNGAAIADADIFAYVDVPDVTLNTNDTVQYTWTVNVD